MARTRRPAVRWCLHDEIPSIGSESEGGNVTAADVRRTWNWYSKQWPSQAVRYAGCKGCIHLRSCGAYLCCTYLLDTGKIRPCGVSEECTVKRYPPGYHRSSPKGTPEENGAMVHGAGPDGKPRWRTDGRYTTWDTDYGRSLYDSGWKPREIAKIMEIKETTICGYISQHRWRASRPFPLKHPEGDIETERERYKEYLRERETKKE